MPDFTRFDFNAHNFLNSEAVEIMTDAEAGQYILLLAKSWLLAKAASLPDDPTLLAKWAHCEKVSDLVLSKFPQVETEFGARRRNEVLYQEWIKTLDRTVSASENGKIGAATRWGGYRDANGEVNRVAMTPSITQTNPNQAIPNQSKPSDGGNFKNLAVRYRKSFHVNLSHGAIQKDEYSKACIQFGEDTVLEKFDEWALENMWIKERRHTNGLRQFYEALPAMIEADAAVKIEEEEKQQASVHQVEIEEASVVAGHAEFLEREKKLAAKRAAEEEIAARVASNPDSLFGG